MAGQQIDEKIFIDVNGCRQGMFIQSVNADNPVLLFLHGGPGSPEVAFNAVHPTGFEKIFTVCWWEQRGSGISYSGKIPKESLTLDQMIEDTIAVTNYLRKRFGKDKIFLMGHSWGTVLGILSTQKAPELYQAYIGMGQVTHQDKSERLAYTYMLNEFRARGNQKMVRKLEKFPIDKGGTITNSYLSTRNDCMLQLGIGVMHDMRSMFECVKMVLRYKGYTVVEKFKYPIGNSSGLATLWDSVMGKNFCELVRELKVPVYICQGKYDYQVSYALAKEFLQGLDAPIKGFYTFENSAHSPCFEEPEKMYNILRTDVLQNTVSLAD